MRHVNEALDEEIELYIAMIEISLGIGSSKQDLLKRLVEKLCINRNEIIPELKNSDKVSANFQTSSFLENKLPQLWLKSLKYDAILEEPQRLESEEIKEKIQLDKIKAIIGD